MTKIISASLLSAVFTLAAGSANAQMKTTSLTEKQASHFAALAMKCISREFPNKPEHVINNESEVQSPKALHPSFYGCLDWHSSVHGHWMLVRLLKTFPDMSSKAQIIATLNNTFQPEKMKEEAAYFSKYAVAETYERTYGWAWLLKLDEELASWNDPDSKRWHAAM